MLTTIPPTLPAGRHRTPPALAPARGPRPRLPPRPRLLPARAPRPLAPAPRRHSRHRGPPRAPPAPAQRGRLRGALSLPGCPWSPRSTAPLPPGHASSGSRLAEAPLRRGLGQGTARPPPAAGRVPRSPFHRPRWPGQWAARGCGPRPSAPLLDCGPRSGRVDRLSGASGWTEGDTSDQKKKRRAASPSGNRTPVSRVTGGDTHHYTNEDGGPATRPVPSVASDASP